MALVSCSEDTGLRGKSAGSGEIGFTIMENLISRGAPSDGRVFGENDKIYVTGLHVDKSGRKDLQFTGTEFSYKTDAENSESYWCASPMLYYPYDGTMYFLAYNTDREVTATWTGTDDLEKLTLEFGNALDGQEDVLYSEYLKVPCSGTVGIMPLKFNHALAWLNFRVKKGETTPAGIVTVNSITVNDVALGGTLTVTPSISGSTPSVSAEWTEKTTPAAKTIAGFDATKLDSEHTELSIGNGVMVVPGSQTTLTISYSLDFGGGQELVEGLTYTCPIGEGLSWEMGKKYLYNITIDLQEIKVELDEDDVSGFEDGNSEDIQ